MNEPKHTKGPWHVDNGFILGPNEELIADPRCLPVDDDNIVEMNANTDLIVMAPEMVEKLQEALEWIERTQRDFNLEPDGTTDGIKEVLAKALNSGGK